MTAFELVDLLERRHQAQKSYLEFLRMPVLSLGIYVLPKDGVDPQKPHREAEVYYVLRGRATVQVDGQDRRVQPGSVLFVPAGVPHHFHTIVEELCLLVFFAPAESS